MLSKSYKKELEFCKSLLRPLNTKRVYFVGGCVRDALQGVKTKDFDVEIYGVSKERLESFMLSFGASAVGKSFFVYKYKNFDFALARVEKKVGLGHKGFEVSVCEDEKKGALRRDFTINALMYNIYEEKLYDFYGGVKDLKNSLLRHIDETSFKQDPLRVLRAVQFAARFSLKIDPKSLKMMKDMNLDELSFERIRVELYKFFQAKDLARGLLYLHKLGLVKKLFANVCVEKDFYKLLLKARKTQLKEGLFLYLFLNFYNINKKEFFRKTGLKKELLRCALQPFYKEQNAQSLCEVALLMPIKDYLGCYLEKDILLAKRLKIYNEKLKVKFDLTNIKEKGENLGKIIKKIQKQKIQAYIKEAL